MPPSRTRTSAGHRPHRREHVEDSGSRRDRCKRPRKGVRPPRDAISPAGVAGAAATAMAATGRTVWMSRSARSPAGASRTRARIGCGSAPTTSSTATIEDGPRPMNARGPVSRSPVSHHGARGGLNGWRGKRCCPWTYRAPVPLRSASVSARLPGGSPTEASYPADRLRPASPGQGDPVSSVSVTEFDVVCRFHPRRRERHHRTGRDMSGAPGAHRAVDGPAGAPVVMIRLGRGAASDPAGQVSTPRGSRWPADRGSDGLAATSNGFG